MRTNKRFIKSIIKTASQPIAEMPWARGNARTLFIKNRSMVLSTHNLAA